MIYSLFFHFSILFESIVLNDFFITCSLLKFELLNIFKALIFALGWLILY